jgi:hypothetical protein
MINTWFTADFHLGHQNIIRYCNRPFHSTGEMDEAILGNLNSLVRQDCADPIRRRTIHSNPAESVIRSEPRVGRAEKLDRRPTRHSAGPSDDRIYRRNVQGAAWARCGPTRARPGWMG